MRITTVKEVKPHFDVTYHQHKDKPQVICECLNMKQARFHKWKWSGDMCKEEYTLKLVTKEFTAAFKQIYQKEYNLIWGNKLEEL